MFTFLGYPTQLHCKRQFVGMYTVVVQKQSQMYFVLFAGCASANPVSPDYVPTINMGYNKENLKTPELRKGRHDRAERRERHRSEAEENKRAMSDAAAALMDLSSAGNCFDDSYTQLDADTEDSPPKKKDTTELDGCLQEMANLRLRNQLLVQELSRLQEENRRKKEEAEASKFEAGYLRRGNSTQRTAFYTGLPNLAVFEWLVSYVRDSLPHFDSVTVEDAILIVLMKIRLNTPNFDLGCRFGVSSTTISDILNKCIPVVA